MDEKRKIVMENGLEMAGTGFGAYVDAVNEIVFNTAMAGYQEIVTDPSYTAQAVVMTYPLIGNYGITDEDYETKTPTMGGMIVREYNDIPSNFRYTKTLSEILEENGIPGIQGIDTRRLTRVIRDEGSQKVLITDFDTPHQEAMERLNAYKMPTDQVSRVSCKKKWYARTAGHRFNVVAVDCGIKLNIVHLDIPLEHFRQHGFHEENQVGDGNILAHHHALHLEEGVFVAGVGALVAEAPAGKHGLDGHAGFDEPGAVLAVNGVLGGGGLGLEQLAVIQIIGILHIPGGMEFGDIQGFKAFVVRHHFAVILHGKAHGAENGFQLALHQGDGMIGAPVHGGGHGNVEHRQRVDFLPQRFFPEGFQALGQLVGDLALEIVDLLCAEGALTGREDAVSPWMDYL